MSTEFINDQWRLPNAWNGTESNVNKQSNYSMDFDAASSDYIDLGNITELNNLSAISTSSWFKTSNVSNAPIILNGGSSSTNRFYLQLYFVGSIRYVIGSSVENITVSNIADGNWHHISTVQNGTSLDIYLDGAKQNTSTITVVSPSTNIGDNFKIGRYFLSAANYFDGQIDGVAIFNYALSSSQITTLYGSSSTGIGNPMSLSPKPVAYYPLGDQDAFNGASYLTPNASLKDFVFDFDGTISSAKYVSLTTTTLPSGNSPFTMSVWLNRDTSVPSYAGVLSFGDIGSTNGLSMAYINFNTTNQIKYGFYGGDAGTTSIDENVWHHVVLTYDGTNATFYINKQSITSSQPGTLLIPSTSIVKIGGLNTSSQNFNGEMSNAQIFNTALPATGSNSVETLYNNGSPLTSMSGFTSLVSWWKLNASDTYDSSTGNWTIEDHAGSNDGTSSGMTQANLVQSDLSFTSGYSPYALEFDAASNDKITASSNSNFNTGDLSASIWINASNLGNNIKYFFGNSNALATAGFTFSVNTSTGNAWYIGRATTTHMYVINNVSINFTNNVWNHLCFSYDDTTKGFILYLNGASVNSGTATSTTKNASGSIIFGGHNVNYDLTGKLSNASIWNTALTSAQVTEIYSEGVPQNLLNHSAVSSLVSWWQLGSNSSFNTNWTVLDEKGSNNGTSSNMGEDAIVDGVGSYANGLSSGMGGDEVIGDAPYSTANSLSVNMDVLDRVEDTPA